MLLDRIFSNFTLAWVLSDAIDAPMSVIPPTALAPNPHLSETTPCYTVQNTTLDISTQLWYRRVHRSSTHLLIPSSTTGGPQMYIDLSTLLFSLTLCIAQSAMPCNTGSSQLWHKFVQSKGKQSVVEEKTWRGWVRIRDQSRTPRGLATQHPLRPCKLTPTFHFHFLGLILHSLSMDQSQPPRNPTPPPMTMQVDSNFSVSWAHFTFTFYGSVSASPYLNTINFQIDSKLSYHFHFL